MNARHKRCRGNRLCVGRETMNTERASFSDQKAVFETFFSLSVFNCCRVISLRSLADTADSFCIVPLLLCLATVERIDRAVKRRKPIPTKISHSSRLFKVHSPCPMTGCILKIRQEISQRFNIHVCLTTILNALYRAILTSFICIYV